MEIYKVYTQGLKQISEQFFFMEDLDETENDPSEEQLLEQGEIESTEEAFLRGYAEDEEVTECAECGKAIEREDKRVSKEINNETYTFCSKDCAKDFEESVKTEE